MNGGSPFHCDRHCVHWSLAAAFGFPRQGNPTFFARNGSGDSNRVFLNVSLFMKEGRRGEQSLSAVDVCKERRIKRFCHVMLYAVCAF